MTEERLLAFAKAWSDKNIDEVMNFFTEDCIYKPSLFEGDKEYFVGKLEVADAVLQMMKLDDSKSSKVSNIRVIEEFGFWEWEYELAENKIIKGCDSFRFKNQLIHIKNAFRKVNIN